MNMNEKIARQIKILAYKFIAREYKINPKNNGKVAVYTANKIMYNRIKKSGNSSILLFMDQITGNSEHAFTNNYESDKNKCIRRTINPFDLSLNEIRNLDEYFIFTIFRNPYARCLSMFLQKVASGKKGYEFVTGFGDNSAGGFEKFVTFLENGGLRADQHFFPQADLLFFRPEDFSHIGKLENLDAELRHVCARTGLRFPDDLQASQPHRSEESQRGKITKAADKLRQYYNADLFERVSSLYGTDFVIGGYDARQTR